MKKLLLALAVVGATLFTACNKDQDCGHEFIEHDFSKDLVGTWTYLEEGQAEAMVIKEDGSFTITGVMNGGVGAMYEEKGTIKVVNNKVTLAYNSGDVFEGRLELVAGKSLSIVLFEKENIRLTYDYCENDLADEIVGMWVCNDGPTSAKGDMMIQVFNADGSTVMTGHADELLVNDKSTSYKVVGDLVFLTMNKESVKYETFKMTYSPNGTAFGDVMTLTLGGNYANIAPTTTWLRVKENLNLAGKTYDYISAYVTNVKGKDEDFSIVGNTFNIAKMNAGNFDMMFRSVLSCLEFPNATTIKQHFLTNGVESGFDTPITVEGNKVTLDMSAGNPAYRKVEMYMFQDADDSQLHIYMPTASFINYFANLELVTLLVDGKIDLNDATAVAKVFTDMEARIESVNVSLVYKARN